MKVVLQRVSRASVIINNAIHSSIGNGMLILLGVCKSDNESDVERLVSKIIKLRIFNDQNEQMNISNEDNGGGYMVISQFTLYADTMKGNRPSFLEAARPEQAVPLYELFVRQLGEKTGKVIQTGVFGADMKVELVNDGPVTIVMDSLAHGKE